MQRPHPRYGKVRNRYVYGIRDLQVLSNRLSSIVEDCVRAANTPDSRDKYFAKPVHEFDPVLAEQLQTNKQSLDSRIQGVQFAMVAAEDLIPKIEACAESMRGFDRRMATSEERIGKTKKKMWELNAGETALMGQQLAMGLKPGDTRALAAEDCYLIKSRNPEASSGFYWLAPRCSSQPFRAWCDMDTGAMYYAWNGLPLRKPSTSILSLVTSVDDVRLHCAEMGLEPVAIRSRSEVAAISLVLMKMGFDLNSKLAVPLAYDPQCLTGRCSGTFRDLMLGNDVTSVLMEASTPETAQGAFGGFNAAGVGRGNRAVSFFDLGTADISAIVCSTNTGLTDQATQRLEIDCETVAKNNPIFQALPDTNVDVECPAGCDEDKTLPLYGGMSVYHAASSVCLAGIHNGNLVHGGTMSVSIESSRPRYPGVIQHGVRSTAVENDDNTFTIRVGPPPKDCPIDLVELAPSSAFLQLSSQWNRDSTPARLSALQPARGLDIRAKSLPLNDPSLRKASGRFTSLSFLQTSAVPLSEPRVPMEVNEQISKTYEMINEAHGVDPHLVVLIQESCADVIGRSRGVLKPAEMMNQQQGRRAIDIFGTTENLSETLYQTTGQSYSALEEMTHQLQRLDERRMQQRGFGTWEFNYDRDVFSFTWETYTSLGATGSGEWMYSPPGTGIHPRTITQRGRVLRETELYGAGTFMRLRNRRFFDFIFTSYFMVQGDGPVVGVAFRMRDWQNTYLLELDRAHGGTRRLLRLYRGVATVLCERHDGGYVPNTWYLVHIETSHGRMRICVAEEGRPLDTLFDIQDETFLSGAIGFFAADTSQTAPVHFDMIKVLAKHCTPLGCSTTHPPVASDCNTIADAYFMRFKSFYSIHDNDGAQSGPSQWSYVRDAEGRHTAIRQASPITTAMGPASFIVTSGVRSCPHGLFNFDFLANCDSGAIGAIFRYKDTSNYYLVDVSATGAITLKRKADCHFTNIQPIARTHAPVLNPKRWTSLSVLFSGPLVKVHIGPSDGSTEALELTYRVPPGDVPSLQQLRPGKFRVGLGTTNCPGALFDGLRVGPVELMKALQGEILQTALPVAAFLAGGTARDFTSVPRTAYAKCLTARSFLERQRTCLQLSASTRDATTRGPQPDACLTDFCSTCCAYQTSLLSRAERVTCLTGCSDNDLFSNVTRDAWHESLKRCVKHSPDMDHCHRWLGNKQTPTEKLDCQRESCEACCQTLPAFDVLRDGAMKKATNASFVPAIFSAEKLEVSHCRALCRKRYMKMPSLQTD